MNANSPHVSVVIPAYNQAHYLGKTIESVLAQSYKDYEIIVVNDGSTDNSEEVSKMYAPDIRYIYQDNQGLAGARNSGIRRARGKYVALLDSDDLWLPAFLKSMTALAAANPEAAVFYCGMHYIDTAGNPLPQRGRIKPIPPQEMYNVMLRANHLVPSTIVARRSVLLEAGLFDIDFRRLQDWELWIRLLRQNRTFIGLDKCLIQYRIHDDSLSTNPTNGQKAALAMIKKHFGEDDGLWQSWPADKRRAYGGLYRYYALTTSLLRQGDWKTCAIYLQKAFLADPTLAADLSLFYELALGAQPMGHRGDLSTFDSEKNGQVLINLLVQIFSDKTADTLDSIKNTAYANAYLALGILNYSARQFQQARHYLYQALKTEPKYGLKRQLMAPLVKSFLGPNVVNKLHRSKKM